MIFQDNYQGSSPNPATRTSLAFADGGLPELMRWLETAPHVRGYGHGSGGPSEEPSDFNGYSTWESTLKMARDGWPEGAAQIARGFPAPTFGASSRKPKWGFDVAGDLPDVGRYLSGHPDAMRRRKVDRGRAPVVVLYIACGVRAEISTTEYRNFGQAVCEMIDALENAGTRVELNQLTRAFTASHSSGRGGSKRNWQDYSVTGWRVKEATEPLDLSTVAFTYMHPAAHRRLQFQMRSRVGSGSVGGSTTPKPADFPDAPESGLFVEGVSEAKRACDTVQGARDFLRSRINRAAGQELITEEMIDHLAA